MLSALISSERSYRAVRLAPQPVHRRFVQLGPLVLESGPLKLLLGEQPNPWDLLQPQDVTSRHRGAKPLRRYELLGVISLLSPEYLLSFERWPFHAEPPDHYIPVSCLFDLSVSQSSALLLLHSTHGYQAC